MDPYGLFELSDPATWPAVNQSLVDFGAGFGDALLVGTGGFLRKMVGISGAVNKCSNSYRAGAWASFALGASRLAYAGVVKGYSLTASSGVAASQFRNQAKNFFRFGAGKNWRQPDLSKYPTDDALRMAAGRTNTLMNAYGAGVTVAGAYGGSGCGCNP